DVVENDVGEALLLVAGEQAREQGVAVVARKAPPDDARVRIDERCRPPVAEDGEIETVIRHEARLWSAGASCSSQARTSAGAAKQPSTPLALRPTENAIPSSSGMIANTVSSVVSSPMKIGRRPWNGACVISSRTPVPLLKPACLTSITALPGRTSIGASHG